MIKVHTVSGLALLSLAFSLSAATTINDSNKYGYGANVGWMNVRGDVTNGAVIGEFCCSGYVYGANIGWIHLGDGTPDNGYEYSNTSATDYGVNHDGLGRLRGYAYGANIGWINFETNGAPRVDLDTGILSGYAYGANVGWISLSNAYAFVQTDSLSSAPDSDGDGIADAWEYRETGGLGTLSADGHDADNDGATDVQEYGADTDPELDTDSLRITDLTIPNDTDAVLTWTTRQTRRYRVSLAPALTGAPAWVDSGLGLQPPDAGTETVRTVPGGASATSRFYRVKSVVPLSE